MQSDPKLLYILQTPSLVSDIIVKFSVIFFEKGILSPSLSILSAAGGLKKYPYEIFDYIAEEEVTKINIIIVKIIKI